MKQRLSAAFFPLSLCFALFAPSLALAASPAYNAPTQTILEAAYENTLSFWIPVQNLISGLESNSSSAQFASVAAPLVPIVSPPSFKPAPALQEDNTTSSVGALLASAASAWEEISSWVTTKFQKTADYFAPSATQPSIVPPPPSPSPSPSRSATLSTDSATSTGSTALTTGSSGQVTVVNQYITQPVVERTMQTVAAPSAGYVTQDTFTTAINALNDKFGKIIYGTTYPAPATNYGSGGVINSISLSNKIDQLSGTSLSSITVSGVSGLTDADIPDGITASNYLPLAGGTLTGTLYVSTLNASSTNYDNFIATNSTTTNATSTNFFATNASTTNATSTHLFASNFSLGSLAGFLKATAGAVGTALINLASDVTGILPVGNGGTGWSNIAASAIPYGNGSGALATTTAGTAGYVLSYLNGVPTWTATSTLANISGTLAVTSGGTGQTSFGQGWLSSNGTTLSASTSPTVNYITATSTTATSTFSTAGFTIGSSWFVVQQGSGFVGIGTTTPNTTLTVTSSGANGINLDKDTSSGVNSSRLFFSGGSVFSMRAEGNNLDFNSGAIAGSSSGTTRMVMTSTGLVGIATTTPWRTFSVTGTVGLDGLTGNFGAGSLCLTANKEVVYNSGSDACLSSLRATKHDITPLAVDYLSQVAALGPVSFIYNNDASSTVRYGFIAEDAAAVDTHLGTYDAAGHLSGVDDRGLLAIIVGAVQNIASITGAFKDNLIAWLADSTNGIKKFFADEGHFKTLCVSKSNGSDVCVTGDQLAAALAGNSSSGSSTTSDTSDSSTAPDSPPVIEVQGNNPAHIAIGSTYSDLGATITGPTEADKNLGIKAFVGTTPFEFATIDTNAPATYHLYYVATNAAGTATSTRTVIVDAADTGAADATTTDTAASDTTTTDETTTTTHAQ